MKKTIKRAAALIFAVLLCGLGPVLYVPAVAGDPVAADIELPEAPAAGQQNTYAEYFTKHKDTGYPIEEIALGAGDVAISNKAEVGASGELNISETGFAEWEFSVKTGGLYSMAANYMSLEGNKANLLAGIEIDGAAPFIEALGIRLDRIWKNRTEIQKDNQGNHIAPTQDEAREWNILVLNGADNYHTGSYRFYLSEGSHRVRFISQTGGTAIKSLTFFNSAGLPDYKEYKAAMDAAGAAEISAEPLTFEAEDASLKSEINLAPTYDKSNPSVSPNDPAKVRINVIGGGNWSDSGDWIEWNISVAQTGYYSLAFKYKQDSLVGLAARRKIYLDGQVPFKELGEVKFPYTSSWEYKIPGGDSGNYLIYLTADKPHTLRMEAVIGDVGPALQMINKSLLDLNAIYREIIMITGVTPDPFNDYFLDSQMPHLIPSLQTAVNDLTAAAASLEASGGSSGSEASSLHVVVKQLKKHIEDPETLQSSLDTYKANLSMLSDLLLRLKQQPLRLDFFVVSPDMQKLEKPNAGIFSTISFRFQAFCASFIHDYSSIGNAYGSDEEPLRVWVSANDLQLTGVSSGRDQAMLLKQHIDNEFSPQKQVDVNLSLVSTSDALLRSIVGGQAPDVALFVPKTLPVSLAIRGAIDDLSQSEYMDGWKERVYPSAFIPYQYDKGIYGMPETQIYNVLYYRADIFEDLGLKLPDTWADFYKVTESLQGKQFGVGMLADQTTFIMLLLQAGQNVYNSDLSKTALTTPEAIEVFGRWADLYITRGFELSYDFFSRFRTGEMPMGIAPLTFFNQLSVGAPEITNMWNIAPIPGTVTEDGINRSQGCVTTASIVMSASKNKQNAYKFIDWWTSDSVQSYFGNSMEGLIGTAARYNTANIEAAKELNWTSYQRKVLETLWPQVSDVPQTPASYEFDRDILNAFRKVVYNNDNPREVMYHYAKVIDSELTRKRQEYGLN